MFLSSRVLGPALAMTALAATAWAQGSQTGILTGRVESSDGNPLPGVTVVATAPALQGERSAVTTENGDYILKGLPAGRYRVRFELQGFSTVDQTTEVEIAQSSTVNATMGVATVRMD